MAQAPKADRADPTPARNESADTSSSVRQDPKPRRYNPVVAGHIKNQNPNRVYAFCDPRESQYGLQHHLDLGWAKIDAKSDPERVYSGRIEDNKSDVTYLGQLLVWMDKEEYQDMLAGRRDVLKARQAQAQAKGGIDRITNPVPPGGRETLAEHM